MSQWQNWNDNVDQSPMTIISVVQFYVMCYSNVTIDSIYTLYVLKQIEIKEMDPNTLSLVLDYIYNGEVELSIGNVQNVLSAANLFQVLPLRDGCAAFMLQHISVANCIGIYFFAKAHECYRLAARAHLIVKTEFEDVCRELEFRALLTEEQLIELISDDQVCHDISLYKGRFDL